MVTFEDFLNRVFAQSEAIELPRDLRLRNLGGWDGYQKERTKGEAFQMINSREYDPKADSLEYVDWAASSTSPKLIVIEYDSEKRTIIHVLPDLRKSMFLGTRRVDKIGLMAELLCSLIKASVGARNHVAAHFFSEYRLLRNFRAYEAQGLLIPVLRAIYELGRQDAAADGLWQGSLLEELLSLVRNIWACLCGKSKASKTTADHSEEDDNDSDNQAESGFCQALRAIPRSREKRLVIIPSDFHNMSEEDFTQLEAVARVHIVCCLVLVQPGDYELPPTDGAIVYQDLTSGENVPVQVDPEQRRQYAAKFEVKSDLLRQRLEEAGCRCEWFSTVDSPDVIGSKLTSLLSSKR